MDSLNTQNAKADLEIVLGRGDWRYLVKDAGFDLMVCTDTKGKQRQFLLLPEADKDGVIHLQAKTGELGRGDGKFFCVPLMIASYDRPIIEQFGVGHVALILHDGKIVVEDEKFPSDVVAEEFVTQKRLPRASADNLAYSSLSFGEIVGRDYLDSQRIIYADAPNKFTAGHNVEIPVKNEVAIENGKQVLTGNTVPLQTMSLKEYGKSADGPGKVALADAILHYLGEDELEELARKLEACIDVHAQLND